MMSDCINDYRIVDSLGEGAYGKVYKALGVDKKYYALKMIPINPKLKDKIQQEGRLLTSMDHPNVLWARQFFYYQQEKYFVIITQYCNNGGLDNHIGSLSQEKQLEIMKGMARGLYYLHREKDIIHRDLKPQNILLSDWTPKIADMGVAKILKNYHATTKIGTPTYMAYEMLEGDYNIEVDIWALGIIYLEIIIGERIFQLLKGQEIPSKRQSFPSQQLLSKIECEKLRRMVREMLKKNPKQRITAQQILKYLDSNQITISKVKNSISQQKKIKQNYNDLISDCYIKTEQFWCNKYQLAFIKQLYEKNMVQIVTQGEQGNKKAQFLLAKMYEYGFGMIKSIQKSEQYLLKCYQQQQPHCCYQLYLLSTSPTQKFQYLMMGKQYQERRCLYKLAQNYLEGLDNLSIDYQQSEMIIEDLCQKNYPKAYLLKGSLHLKINTQYFNIQKMRESYKKGSDLGNIPCKLLLAADLYKQKKYQEIIQLNKTIDPTILDIKDRQNHFELMAKCYSKLKNTEKTVQFYYKCMQIDDGVIERDYLGSIAAYLQSIHQQQKAIDYYNQAIVRLKSKYTRSQYFADRLKSHCVILYTLYYQRKKYKYAYIMATMSAEFGFESGKADQAYMIYGGMGVDKNQVLGLQLLTKYAKQNNQQAISYLNFINLKKK